MGCAIREFFFLTIFRLCFLHAVANSLQYECVYQVTDDYPPQSDSTNIIFKAGDRIVQVCMYGELPLIWTPEIWPPLYSGHFEKYQKLAL